MDASVPARKALSTDGVSGWHVRGAPVSLRHGDTIAMAKGYGPRKPPGGSINTAKLDQIVAKGRKDADTRMSGYREQSLKLYPWVCARCGRTFARENLHELTVHHKDHNHDNNPLDGSNWELGTNGNEQMGTDPFKKDYALGI